MDAWLRAREYFPRGLAQPEGGYRFSMDALLLGAWLKPLKNEKVIDLGCGCGAAGFALALLNSEKNLFVTGLELDAAACACAGDNAAKLGLDKYYQVLEADLRQARELPELKPESFGLALANPPYRRPGTGRMCKDEAVNPARFETAADLADFARAAAYLLKNRGKFGLIYPADRLAEAFAALGEVSLAPKRLLPLCGKPGSAVRLTLVEAVKNASPGLVFLPPLALYEPGAGKTRLSREALDFCPYLSCNQKAQGDD